jgi:tetratricopeptide (TPR) repeat protein
VGDFVGREREIDTLINALRRESRACIVGISGMGGVGKTELALLVAERLRDDYPDAQFFINLQGTDDNPRSPQDVMVTCVRAFLGPESKLPETPEQLLHLYRSQLDGKRALLLLDNAADSAQVRPLLPPTGCAVLITSRQSVALPGMTPLTLHPLTEEEAQRLLLEIAPRAEPVAEQICKLCGYLPLALRAAGSLLAITADLDPADYAAQLQDERSRLERIGTEGVDIDVAASFNLSYARLSTEAARVFRLLSVFPATFDAIAEEVVCADAGHVQLSDLVRRSLVVYDTGTKRYRLHDLARLFADTKLSAEERDLGQKRFATHYKNVLAAAKELYKEGGESQLHGLALVDLEWGNIQAGHGWVVAQTDTTDADVTQLGMTYPDAGVYVLYLRQHSREWIRWLEIALAAARRLQNRAGEGVTLGNLGIAYKNLGETRRAIQFYEQHLAIAREISDRRGEGVALGNLGNAYYLLDETRRAVEFLEQNLVIACEIGDRRGEATALGNLGLAYADLGETRRAIQFYEQCRTIAREIGDRQCEGNALRNLGLAYAALGKTRRAIQFYEQHLTIALEIGDRRGEGNVLWNMSLVLDQLGERAQAIQYIEQALIIYEQLENPYAAKLRAQLAAWREQTNP